MKQIEVIMNFTNNYRFIYHTKIAAALKIRKSNNKAVIEVPLSISDAQLDLYKAGGTIYIVGNEITENLSIEIDNGLPINNFYDTQGLVPLLTRQYTGSIYNGGYHEIESVDVQNRTITLKTPEDEIIEEDFNGTIVISAWNGNNTNIKAVLLYLESQHGQSGLISESVKNYSYTLSDSKNRVQAGTGLPIDLLLPFKRFKKLPAIALKQLKELLYAF